MARSHDAASGHHPRNPLVALPARLRARLRDGARRSTRGLLELALDARRPFRDRLPGVSCCLASAWRRSWAATSSRRSTPAQITLHVRAPVGTRIEETAALFDRIESAHPPGRSRPTSSDSIVDNIGLPVSGINTRLSQHRRDRPAGRRHPRHA